MARVTLQTIAERVGVSRMTVSNAFSRPDQLSAALRATILETAAEMGYVGPDPAARALAKGTTGAVGILLTNSMTTAFRDDVATSFFGAVAEELAPTGLAVTLLPLYGSADTIPARDVPIDGALVYACPDGAPALDWLVRRRLPLVFVDREPTPGAASVTLDERGGGRQGAEHLVELGHRHVGLLTSSFEGPHGIVPDPLAAGGDFVARERVAAWTQTLGDAGVRVTAAQVRENTDREGYDGARLLLDDDDRPTGLLCFSDTLAWGAVRAAQDLDLRVPQDVSVIGFDDAQIARRARPALTTIRQDVVAKGRAAAAQLTAAIARARDGVTGADGVGGSGEPVRVVLPTELVVRHSTGPVPA